LTSSDSPHPYFSSRELPYVKDIRLLRGVATRDSKNHLLKKHEVYLQAGVLLLLEVAPNNIIHSDFEQDGRLGHPLSRPAGS
jgi:nucleosome binding factor SPN SPT16 subunit